MWTLVVESGKHKGRRVKLKTDRVIIGRAEDAQIRVGSTDVSRHHCELLPTAHGVLVNDLDSRNGTLINGEPISTEFLLAPGNTMSVGPMSFRLLPKDPSPQTRKGEDAQKLSDDDISSWLTDAEDSLQSDTTVIGGRATIDPAEPEAVTEETSESGILVPPPSKAKFDSVGEEAADIIRRHEEMVAAREAEDAQ